MVSFKGGPIIFTSSSMNIDSTDKIVDNLNNMTLNVNSSIIDTENRLRSPSFQLSDDGGLMFSTG